MSLELLTMGRVGVDLYPQQTGVSLADVASFSKSLGGTATNVAVACARFGHRTGVITKVGDDGFGPYVRRALEGFGVSSAYVGTDPDLRTPIVFCELHPPNHFPLLFYREPKAPDMNLRFEDLDHTAIAEAEIFWTTGTGLSDEPSRSTTLAALDLRSPTSVTIHDLDYRPMFWSAPEEAGQWQREVLAKVSIAIGNIEECSVAVGPGSPLEMATRILELGPRVAIVKQGPGGVTAYTANDAISRAPISIDVVNGLGAGDAFGGAICHGILAGWGWAETLSFANAAGAYVACQLACADAMPDEREVRTFMGAHGVSS